eukprot:TRINITY_DN6366_c0_g1_i2.p1 TRINITY_DN6366_c0_g1~~TRINITY_DN6366_c0_g1_i2.p1  ORF type:complete len:516 (+),score=74.58 TRINITY_DN6366_c0_g1_i2:36-1583(+)
MQKKSPKPPANQTNAKSAPTSKKLFGSGLIAVAFFVGLVAIYVSLGPSMTLFRSAGVKSASYTTSKGAPIPDHDRFSLRHYNIQGKVPVILWEPTKPFAKEVIRLGKPVVLRNTFVSQWPAIKRLNEATLIQRSGDKLFDFKILQNDKIFVYSQPKQLDQLPELNFREPFNLTYKTVKQFWEHSKTADTPNNDQKSWLYFTGCLERSEDELKEFPALLNELPNLRGFIANDKFFATNLWLGSRGVTAQTHYDQAPNFAAQVYGHKRWILSPPSEAPKMYGYPWLHPFRSQSQVDFASPSVRSIDYRARKGGIVAPTTGDDFPLFGNITAVEALMEPGDVLYIPPLWYHRVVTEDASIAINSWTDPPEGDPFARLTKLPIPAEEDWNQQQLTASLLRFFREISRRFPHLDFPGAPANTEWTFALLKQQYSTLWKNNIIPFGEGMSKKISCTLGDEKLLEPIQAKFGSRDYISEVVAALESYQDIHTQRLEFAAYIEKVTEFLLGVEHVYSFIVDCL